MVTSKKISPISPELCGGAASSMLTADARPSTSNFSTVAILGVTDDVPLSAFTLELYHALTAIGPTLQLTSDLIRKNLGPTALVSKSSHLLLSTMIIMACTTCTRDKQKKNHMAKVSDVSSANEYRLCSWLGQQEDQHRVVLYQCDTTFTAWTQRCIRQADCILIVALADHEPAVGKVLSFTGRCSTVIAAILYNKSPLSTTVDTVVTQIESQIEQLSARTQKELILLHREDGPRPSNTVHWLNIRAWCCSHHHIRCPPRVFARKTQFKLMETYGKLFDKSPNIHSDFARLARFLTGTTIGLVLGGGGARGAAHVGMIRAVVEAGIPIDYVGGVSIGAFMGALWCQEKDLTTFTQKAREWSLKMTSYWRQITDLTYPVTAMFTGATFNSLISEVFGDRQIEDLWLPYFTLTTDITSSTARVHTHGKSQFVRRIRHSTTQILHFFFFLPLLLNSRVQPIYILSSNSFDWEMPVSPLNLTIFC
ncbi:PNPLA6 [Cordylochernes scorpioides]|uniref:lysophospholipase n=1 Tax=Cordylochernes scorpioides TaxID=51811 RepID=A0ABY6L468_9ARAC|nr:PNPLA6 [Cordylochernes scorpioides]